MDWKQFFVELVSSLVWPAVVIIIIFQFKTELAKIVQRLAHLKFKDLEIDFEKVKQHAAEVHQEIEDKPVTEVNPTISSLEDQVLDAVEKAPSAAILLAWSGLEVAMASAVSRLAISPESPSYRSPVHNIEMLVKHGGLSKSHATLLHELRALRNKIAHEINTVTSVTQEQAQDYANAAIDMAHHFESMNRDD